jgi:pimeloyl-ACP methyl ester carboxylesterase
MLKLVLGNLISIIAPLSFLVLNGCAQLQTEQKAKVEIGFIEINPDIKLRRMVVHNPEAKGTVLFLHGFPETLYAWKEISTILGKDYEVHAFDWPGYGLSSRPPVEKFAYAPKDYANVLKEYIQKSKINSSKLLIYATDIGALPVLLAAVDEPGIAKKIIVGDFAPFDRPQYMYESLQNLKSKPTSDSTRAYMNKNKDEILANAFYRGLPKEERYELPQDFKDDMAKGWNQSGMTSADAFYYYYSHFTQDQNYFEANLKSFKTPVQVIWGEKDFYIKKEMGLEFAQKLNIKLKVLPNIGHYPHLQIPKQTIDEIESSFKGM